MHTASLRLVRYLFLAIGLWGVLPVFGQPDPGFNYQAVYRNQTGSPVPNKDINVDLRVRRNSTNGAVVYRESHSVTTDVNGLFNLVIGKGNQVSPGGFFEVDWASSPHFLDLRIDGTQIGRIRLEGTPYSLVATHMNLNNLQDVSDKAPSNGQVLKWTGNSWEPARDNSTNLSAGSGIQISNGDITNTQPDQEVDLKAGEGIKIQGSYPTFTLSLEDGIGEAIWETQGKDIYYDEGNVGVGNKDPEFPLDVDGNVRIIGSEIPNQATTASLIIQSSTNSNQGQMLLDGDELDVLNQKMWINRNSEEDLVIADGGGKVGIGTLGQRRLLGVLHIRHQDSEERDGLILQNVQGGANYWALHSLAGTDGEDVTNNLGFSFRGRLVGKIDPSGTYAQVSDLRRKYQIRPLGSVHDLVLGLTPYTYRMQGDDSQKKQVGFLAQEVQKSFPYLVDYDAKEDLYMIKYEGFHAIAIQALKEQQEQIDQLSEQVTQLAAQVQRLDKELKKLAK